MTRWTSVVSYHTDPDSCGVARFSRQLAGRLGVPHYGYGLGMFAWGSRPLLSVKFSEWTPYGCEFMDQLWHDEPPAGYVVTGRVWKLYELGVPALVRPVTLGQAPVFMTFGMSHKLDLDKFRALRASCPGCELWISTADHEGAGPSKVPALMTAWGAGAYNLGHLSDAALSLVWPHVSAFVAFFEHGLRANNSSVHAAIDAGVPVVTNHGDQTPDDLKRHTADYRTYDPEACWPLEPSPYTWDRLLRHLGCEPSRSATA